MLKLALLFLATSQNFNLPPGLLSAICWVESHHNSAAINAHDGGSASHGICQIKLETAALLGFKGTEEELTRPKTNIHYAGKYIKWQLDRYQGNIPKAVAAYNAGTYRENSQGQIMNRKYVGKVFDAWIENKKKFGTVASAK